MLSGTVFAAERTDFPKAPNWKINGEQGEAIVEFPAGPADEWNAVEIEFRGANMQVTINGQLIQDVRSEESSAGAKKQKKSFRPSGRVGLQIHDGHVGLRQIEILELGFTSQK